MSRKLQRVAIAGGTHGNEFTGIYLVKKFQRYPNLVRRPSFKTVPLLANPQAFAIQRRYAEKDLNRCFLPTELQASTSTRYEELRAQELYQTLVANPASKVDFILDLHTTTANMGLTVILVNHHPFNLRLAAYLCAANSAVRVYSAYQPGKPLGFLNSLCELGFAIEIGAIAQGTLRADLFQQAEVLIHTLLDYLDAANREVLPPVAPTLTTYQHLKTVDYPKDEHGELLGMIHPHLQDQDYQPLHPGDPLFLTFAGDAIAYTGNSTVYPIFINEAAYYEKGIALCLTERQTLEL